jgi:RNA polymerase sigma-70 factor, ECF subfamily
MATSKPPASAASAESALADTELVARIGRHEQAAFEILMRRNNSRLFRVARSILRDDAEAEDALQDAYLEAYRRIASFRGDAQLATWLTRIVINQSLMRLRRQKRDRVVVQFAGRDRSDRAQARDFADAAAEPPAVSAERAQVRRMIERRIDELPVAFRTVFVLREVEDMSVDETAACLSISPATVRTRSFRARALLREALARDLDSAAAEIFGFAGERCDRVVAGVLNRLTLDAPPTSA